MSNSTNKAAVFPGLLDKANEAAKDLAKDQATRSKEIVAYKGFFVIRDGEKEDNEKIIHKFTLDSADYLLVTR